MACYKVTTKRTSSQPAGLTKVFNQSSKPSLTQLREWLLKEHGVKSGAGEVDFIIENV